jgi:malate dehydrogenase (quinone)
MLIPGRKKAQPIAATRIAAGTDVDFGSLTRLLVGGLLADGVKLKVEHRVTGLKQRKDGTWRIKLRHEVGGTPQQVDARFVFVGAGGAALNLLQRSGIREISGQFLRTDDPKVVAQHAAKVYGKAAKGSPPMSVPHLDTRVVDGKASLLFGPYAGFSSKFLKTGSYLDLFAALRWHNLFTFIGAGLTNLSLVWYLVTEVLSTRGKRHRALQQFAPRARRGDWRLITAGQRVQIMKRVKGRAVIQFGTEVVSSADGSIAGLLGASPGASTAVPIMLDLIAKCFPDRMAAWQPELERMIPSYGTQLAANKSTAKATLTRTAKALAISA